MEREENQISGTDGPNKTEKVFTTSVFLSLKLKIMCYSCVIEYFLLKTTCIRKMMFGVYRIIDFVYPYIKKGVRT